jgi:hypothetical protein
MGQKTNPISNRLGIIKGWDSEWFDPKNYSDKIVEDDKIRKYLNVMLDERDIPARVMKPEGFWNNDYTAFTMKDEFRTSVASAFGVKPSESSVVTTKPTEPE